MGERRDKFSACGVKDFYRRLDFRGRLILPTARKILARRRGQLAAVRRKRELPVPKSMCLNPTRAPAGFHVMPEQLAVVASGNERAPVREQHASAGEGWMLLLERLRFPARGVHIIDRSVRAGRKCAEAVGRDSQAKHAAGQLVIVREGEFHEFTPAAR